jgi:hypothetical protein
VEEENKETCFECEERFREVLTQGLREGLAEGKARVGAREAVERRGGKVRQAKIRMEGWAQIDYDALVE